MSPKTLVFIVCLAQVLVQIGAFVWPALLPGMITLWNLSNGEAGWITAMFYGAYMVAVPVLVTLTDRIDAKYVYLFGVALLVLGHLMFVFVADGFATAMLSRALAGIGWAGTYMTGLKLLADKVDDKLMSRAVAGHAASIGISGALSFSLAATLAELGGWQLAFAVSAATAACAWLIIVLLVPWSDKPHEPAQTGKPLLDFGPVFRNRSAMAYAFVYCIHTLEMSALRGWGVVFLAFVAASNGVGSTVFTPTLVATSLALIGALSSIAGNEGSIRFGRRRLIVLAMLGSILIGGTIGFIGPISYPIAVGMMMLYGVVVWLDSSSLTAGTAGSAEPGRRGATLAVHSMLGYAGGFAGPLIVGIALDAAGGHSSFGWGMSFATVAVLMALALAVFVAINPRELAGDGDARVKVSDRP
jgi:MFS family permease